MAEVKNRLPRLRCASISKDAVVYVHRCAAPSPKGVRADGLLMDTDRMLGLPFPSPGLHLHKSQHHKIHPDTRPWKQTDKRVVGTLERWGRPAPVSAEEGGGTVPAPPTGLAF